MSDIFVGPWGGSGGFAWDDGKHAGIREIIIYHSDCIHSISLVYDDNGKPVPSPKYGGNGGQKSEIKLEYPDEILVGVRGHYDQLRSSGTVIRSLVLRSNLRTYGPYGADQGTPFILQMEGGQIAGLKGRCETYINAIGFYLTSVPAKQKTSKHADAGKPGNPTPCHDTPRTIDERLKKDQEEKEHKKKEKAEAHLYTIIKVAKDDDLVEQIGKDIFFDLVDHDKVRSFRIKKRMPFNLFKEEVAKEFGIPVQFQRFWLWAKRLNHTYRPNRPLTMIEETQFVGQLREVSNKVNNAELKLFLEVEFGLDSRSIALPYKTKDDILLFFKLYDPEKEELRYVGRLFVKADGKPIEILSKINEMSGYAPDEEIELYEEIKFEPNIMCEPIDKKFTFQASELEDGDIVCFQKSSSVQSSEQRRYPDVPSFLEYVHNRQIKKMLMRNESKRQPSPEA